MPIVLKIPAEIQTIQDATAVIKDLLETRSHKKVRIYLQQIETEEEAYRIIRLLDTGMLIQYGSFLAKRSHRLFNSPRTFSWICHDLVSRGALFHVEKMILERLSLKEDDPNYVIRKLQLHLLCTMQRIPEAIEVKAILDEAGIILSPDHAAYFYNALQQYDKAENVLKDGLSNSFEKRGDIAYLTYAQLLSNRGEYEEALQTLTEGDSRFPNYPAFKMDRLEIYYHHQQYERFIEEHLSILQAHSLYVQHDYFIYLHAKVLYELEQWDALKEWVTSHEKIFADTMFDNMQLVEEVTRKQLSIIPIQQQVNYCVPATIAMLLKANGVHKRQEEVAEHIFEVTGSKITTTIQYMTSLGFEARLFEGAIDRLKRLIDHGIPVILDFFVDNSSHVQLVKGYDDRLQRLLLQDPNSLQTVSIRYEHFNDVYKLKDRMSIVFVRKEQLKDITFLPEEEHVYFTTILNSLDAYEEDEDTGLTQLLDVFQQYEEKIYPTVLGLSYVQQRHVKDYADAWRKRLIDAFGDGDEEVQMVIANSYLREQKREQYKEWIQKVKSKTAYTHFLLGIAAYQEDDYIDAEIHFERSLERDPFQPIAFSYLAICYQHLQYDYRANAFAEAGLWQDETNDFIRSTYANTLLGIGKTEKAEKIYRALYDEGEGNDAYYAYEVGRSLADRNYERAIEWYQKSKEIDGSVVFPYLRIAEIWEEQEQFSEAINELTEGIQVISTEDVFPLWQELGSNYFSLEQFDKAEEAYRHAKAFDVDGDRLMVVYEAQAIYRQGQFERAVETIERFLDDVSSADVRFRAGAMLFEESFEQAELEVALNFMEEGLQQADESLETYIRLYCDYLDDTSIAERGADFLATVRESYTSVNILCYEAILRHQADDYGEAGRLLNKALELDNRNAFPHYRLGLLYKAVNNLTDAIERMKIALELDPELEGAKDELVMMYVEIGEEDLAKQYALDLFHSCPPLCDIVQLISWLDKEEKQAIYHQLMEREGYVDEEWRLIGITELVPTNQALPLIQAEQSPRMRRQYARLLNRDGQFQQAFDVLKELILEFPEDETLYTIWAESVYKLKKHQRMGLTIHRMSISKELKTTICMKLGEAFFPYLQNYFQDMSEQTSFFKRMKISFKQSPLSVAVDDLFMFAYKNDSANFRPYLTYGQFLYNIGNFIAAHREVMKYLSKHDDEDVLQLAGLSAFFHGFTENKKAYLVKAREHFMELREVVPNYYYGWKYAGDVEYSLGNMQQAIHYYEKAINTNDDAPEAYAPLFMIYEQLGEIDEAIQLFAQFYPRLQQRILEEMEQSFFPMESVFNTLLSIYEEND